MTKNRKKVLLVLLHIVLWLIFLSLPTLFNPRRGLGLAAFMDDLMEPPRWRNGLLLIAVFYFNYYIAIPAFYVRQRYVLLLATFIACFTTFFLLNYFMMPSDLDCIPGPDAVEPPPGGFHVLGNSFNLFMFIIVYCMSFALCLYDQWQQAKEQMLRAQVSFLKGQINPHFLFNALNSIYSLVLTGSDDAPDAIVKLSGMMRYAVTDGGEPMVPLSRELAYIRDYIELQRLRITDSVKINVEVTGDEGGKLMAPLLLIPFVENAFRHGVNSEENSDIRISIVIDGESLNLHVVNNKVNSRQDDIATVGIGIIDARRRLQQIYPGKHKLTISDNQDEYSVLLQIRLL